MMRKMSWKVLVLGLLAVSLLAATGCVSKKKNPRLPSDDPMQGELLMDENGNQYYLDENGNRVYVDGGDDALGLRNGTEMGGSFEAVYFAYDNSQLDPMEMGKVQTVANYLMDNPAYGLVVEGHCDERGSNEYNLALGERRALAVRAAIIGAGIDASRITTRSFGEESPVSMGHDESSWSNDRRAEFVITQ